jgi:Protein of unknown function (DUF3500)
MTNKLIILSFLMITIFTGFTVKNSEEESSEINSAKNIDRVISLANDFKSTLSSTQIADLEFEYTMENIKVWSNLPASLFPRLGIKIGDLNETQTKAIKSLIKEMTGSVPNEGWDEIQQVWLADDFLNTKEVGGKYGAGNYYVAFLGKPSMTSTFEIIVTGHHYTIANTYQNGKLVGVTPRFEAVEPFVFQTNGKTYSPISQERDAMSALLKGLTESQLSLAKSPDKFTNILLTPSKNWVFPETHTGLRLVDLSPSQKKFVINAIKTYTDDINDEDAALILAKYVKDLENTYITYSGTTSLTNQNDYVRIDGPAIWIEFSVQRGQVLPNEPYHFHSIWRDRESDYGGTRK